MSLSTYNRLRRELLEKGRRLRKALLRRDKELIETLSRAVTALIARLQRVISMSEIKRIMAGIGLTVAMQGALNAQSFADPVLNPFGLPNIYNGVWIDHVDIDDDGDLDVFVGAYDNGEASQILFFENIGSASEPTFDNPDTNAFGLDSDYDFLMPEFADIDNDGDMDMLASYEYGLTFFENTGDAQNAQFADPVEAPFGIAVPDSGYVVSPNLVDLDADGDLDLVTGTYLDNGDYNYEAGIYYFENTGDAENPQFGEGEYNPFGETTSYYFAFPALADLDADGDLDLMIGEQYLYYSGSIESNLIYYENTGDAENPQFTERQENPFGLRGGDYLSYPRFADMDDDGDLDLFVGQANADNYDFGSFLYFENEDVSSVVTIIDSDEFMVMPNPSSGIVNITTQLDIERIEVIDAMGRVSAIPAGNPNADLSGLPSGLTILRAITADGEIYLRKVQLVK